MVFTKLVGLGPSLQEDWFNWINILPLLAFGSHETVHKWWMLR